MIAQNRAKSASRPRGKLGKLGKRLLDQKKQSLRARLKQNNKNQLQPKDNAVRPTPLAFDYRELRRKTKQASRVAPPDPYCEAQLSLPTSVSAPQVLSPRVLRKEEDKGQLQPKKYDF